MDACVLNNDARACYDRIIAAIAMIMSCQAGMAFAAAHTFLLLLFNMHYFIRTAFGIARTGFSNLLDLVLGVMQGTGHSGCLWALMSSIMFEQMDDTNGADFYSPNPARHCHCKGEAFVDDAALWILRMGLFLTTLIAMMTSTAQ